jgi:hypothetical protein
LIAATLDVGQSGLDSSAGARLYEVALDRLSVLTGVTSVSVTRDLPGRSGHAVTIVPDGESRGRAAGAVEAAAMTVGARYFETSGLFGVSPMDLTTLGPVAAVLMATAGAAPYGPARWASTQNLTRMFRPD